MTYREKAAAVVGISMLVIIFLGIVITPKAKAFFTSPDGGMIAFSIPCQSPIGFGFWAIKTNSPTPVIYLYPSRTMRANYLVPTTGVTTLGLVGPFITCVTTTFPPVTLSGRVSTMYGTGFGF